MPLEQAAAAMLQGMTAHYLVNSTYPVQAGDTVLVHAAAGGVGQLLIQLAKAKGATVIGTVSTAAKAAKARALGADDMHQLHRGGRRGRRGARADRRARAWPWSTTASARTPSTRSLASLRPRGTLVLFGAASGQVPPFDLQRLNPAARCS